MLCDHRCEARAWLDRQLVQRKVRGAFAERPIQGRRPARFGFAGQGVDQVEAHARKVRLGDVECPLPLVGRMRASEEGEAGIVEALQAERQAVDARGGEIGEARGLDRVRIGFERDFEVVRRRPMLAAPPMIRAETVAGSISEGVPPPKKMEVSVRPGSRLASYARSASSASRHSSWSIARPDVAVEIAIGAFADAERPMDVKRQRLGGHFSAFTSFRKASARWLIGVLLCGIHFAERYLVAVRDEDRDRIRSRCPPRGGQVSVPSTRPSKFSA